MEKLDIKIIYEDRNILALNKPAGLLVHGAIVSKEKTLADWLVKKYPEIKKVGDEPEIRPGIVHRLDKDTSGVLLVAKNQPSFEYLKKQFQERKIKKTYITLASGNIKNDKGLIELPIAKSKKDFRKKTATGKLRGESREAITEYRVLKRFKDYTLVEVLPKTGRTHQIRVHLKSIGYPVVCDKLYGPKNAICPDGLKRHFLHANIIEFDSPSGERTRIEADLPEDLRRVLRGLRRKK